tara:strand:+ start:186 stop:296 length:111 start_codon:yes stop_codon:yes gene_type:complete
VRVGRLRDAVARLDVWRNQLPEELKGVQLTSLPLLL